jgi:hypothetical protein
MQINRISLVVSLLAVALGMFAFGPPATADNGAPKWKVWTYNPSGRAFKGGVPAATNAGIATFAFPATPDTALLVTDHGAYKGTLLGDLTGKTISATVSDSGGPFTYYGQGTPQNPCPGLSFGGGCFFENGVGAPTGGSFTLWSFSANQSDFVAMGAGELRGSALPCIRR